MSVYVRRISVIGMGLMGSSIIRAVREKAHNVEYIAGYDADTKTMSYAIENQLINNSRFDSITETIRGADLIIIAAPLSKYKNIFKIIAPSLKENTIITDVGSVKNFIKTDLLPILKDKSCNFVSSHPIAGSHLSGIQNGTADLFEHKKVIITSVEHNKAIAIETVRTFWETLGSQTEIIKTEVHDKLYCLVSHIPQLLSFIYKRLEVKFDRKTSTQKALNNFLRLTHSNPKLCSEIFFYNQKNIAVYLNQYISILSDYLNLISSKSIDQLDLKLLNAKDKRVKLNNKLSIYSKNLKQNRKIPLFRRNKYLHDLSFPMILTAPLMEMLEDSSLNYAGKGLFDFTEVLLNYRHNFNISKHQEILIPRIRLCVDILTDFVALLKKDDLTVNEIVSFLSVNYVE